MESTPGLSSISLPTRACRNCAHFFIVQRDRVQLYHLQLLLRLQRSSFQDLQARRSVTYMMAICKDERNRRRRSRREQNAAQMRKWRAENPNSIKIYRLKRVYGLTPEAIAAMVASQEGKCGLCRDPLDLKTMQVDHDHECCPGQNSCGSCIRSLLHPLCNGGLGYFKDDVSKLSLAIQYVEAWKSRPDRSTNDRRCRDGEEQTAGDPRNGGARAAIV